MAMEIFQESIKASEFDLNLKHMYEMLIGGQWAFGEPSIFSCTTHKQSASLSPLMTFYKLMKNHTYVKGAKDADCKIK